jgi:hypothetical protein
MKKIETMRWIEGEAKANAAFQLNCADALERQAGMLLNLLLAGAGGALAYAVNLAEKHAAPWLQAGMAAMSVWLFVVAALLLIRVLWSREIYGPANDPENLKAAHEMELIEALAYELENRQFCISKNRNRNDAVGRWLNICRWLATATPAIFAAAWVVVGH